MVKMLITMCFIVVMLCGCLSTRRADRSILEHQNEIDRLESELRARDRAIDNGIRTIEFITERSRGMEGTIDEVIYFFDEYQRAVERLLSDYRKAKDNTAEISEDKHNTATAADTSNSVYDSRVHNVLQTD